MSKTLNEKEKAEVQAVMDDLDIIINTVNDLPNKMKSEGGPEMCREIFKEFIIGFVMLKTAAALEAGIDINS